MTLTWPVVAAVLVGALLHAAWNASVKSSSDKALDTALLSLSSSVIAVPLVAFTGLPAEGSWQWLAASVAIHLAYYSLLAAAYKHGDLGLTYPLMRGAAPLLVALTSAFSFGEWLSPLAWAGVLGVSAGVLVLGLSRHAMDSPRAVSLALLNALVIALYTVVDGLGVRASGNALAYVATLFLFNGLPFGLIVLARRGRAIVLPYLRQRATVAFVGALASMASYAIALWAMTRAPVATIAALRETSVLFAAFLGAKLLREAFTPRRALGTAAILAGVMALRLG